MSEESEINFWNDKFLHLAKEVYQYRFLLSRYIETHIPRAKEYFLGKVGRLEYRYLSKVAPEGIESSIMNYLQKNMDRDIILGSTHIGPHVDDF
ncbi:MAG: hypothetical protein H6767_03325 [Candidatus Peribacteria bacterium]|nr:MAG: hypothetical protein H6767_03325 [Candidatus Peribacteria bacterium]